MPKVNDDETQYMLVVPKSLWREAKMLAAARGQTLKDLLTGLLKLEIKAQAGRRRRV